MKAVPKTDDDKAERALETSCFGCAVSSLVLLIFAAIVGLAFSRYAFGIVF